MSKIKLLGNILTKLRILKNKKGAGIVGVIIGIVIGLIMIINVAVPVVQEGIDNASLTGTTATIANLYPILLVVVGLVLIVGAFGLSEM